MNEDNTSNSAASGTAKTITVEATTGEAMHELGKHVAHLAHGGDVILLSGPLGAGKTTFAQGFGAGLNISEPIVSPTFTIARELKGQFPNGNSAHLIHVDAYRLGGNAYAPGQNAVEHLLDELESLGLDEELEDPSDNTIILMEWGEQMAAALAPERNPHRPAAQHRRHRHNGQYGQPRTHQQRRTYRNLHSRRRILANLRHRTQQTLKHNQQPRFQHRLYSSSQLGTRSFHKMQTLVIDTSYGSTVGMVGHDPIVETDSRTHVEKLQVNIATTVEQAGLKPENIDRIIVGIGPAPFTGLRAGIVAAKALAFATGARLIGQNVLSSQVLVRNAEHDGRHHLTLAVNDARRKQLYFALLDGSGYEVGGSADEDHDANVENSCVKTLIDMDIDYPESIVNRVNEVLEQLRQSDTNVEYVVDVIGHGAAKYAQSWASLPEGGMVSDHALLDEGASGLERFAAFATSQQSLANPEPIEPLYLRRPDVSVPNPLKHVLNHAGAERTE